jgi:phage-related protein
LYSNAQSKFNSIKTAASNLLSAWKNHWNDMVNAVKNIISSIVSAVQSIADKIQAKVSVFKNAGKAIMGGLLDGINDKIDDIKSAINSVNNWIDSHMPHSPAKEGVFQRLPNWDAVFVDPVQSSLAKMNDLTGPISNTLSNIKSPLNEATSGGLSNIQNTSNAYTNAATTIEGNKYSIGPITVRNDSDLQTLIAAVKTSIANDRRKAGII